MKKDLPVLMLTLLILSLFSFGMNKSRLSEQEVRKRILLIHSERGSCTAVQVIAPSKKVYTLSAAHCVDLLIDGKIEALDEYGHKYILSFIAEDKESDLLLLTAPNSLYLKIGKESQLHDSVHTQTHGAGMPTYRTDGETLDERTIDVPAFEVFTQEEFERCALSSKFRMGFGFLGLPMCMLHETVNGTTAHIVPGSSGGPLLNERNEVIGIASAADRMGFSYFVRVADINSFLKNR